jgi:hypothetical protein
VSCCQPAGIANRLAAPHTRGAVEIEEVSSAVAGAVLEHEMAVEQNRLDLREQRVILVDMPPARLHHADLRVGEVWQQAMEKIEFRKEIGVENGDIAAAGDLQPGFERPAL